MSTLQLEVDDNDADEDNLKTSIAIVQLHTDYNLTEEFAEFLTSSKVNISWSVYRLEAFASYEIDTDVFRKGQGQLLNAGKAIEANYEDSHVLVALGCTSLSFALGKPLISQCLNPSGACRTAVVDMATAQVTAIKALGATKAVLITPYQTSVHEKNIKMLQDAGVRVVASHCMGLLTDRLSSRVTRGGILSIITAVLSECDQRAKDSNVEFEFDILVIGCSALRVCKVGFIDMIEHKFNVPVVTSTQAFCWSILQTMGYTERNKISGYGTLFKCY